MHNPSALNEVSDIDEMQTPATIGRSDMNTSSGTVSSLKNISVSATVAIGSPAYVTSKVTATFGTNMKM